MLFDDSFDRFLKELDVEELEEHFFIYNIDVILESGRGQ